MLNVDEIQVASLPSLPLAQRAALPDCPAVYFAIAATGEVLYIGRTLSLIKRWKSHHRKRQLERSGNVQIAWLIADSPAVLAELEDQLVERFEPALNASPVDGNETVSCHVRFPTPLYRWLMDKAQPEFKSPQKKVIELVLAAQEAESRQEQAA